MKHLTVCLSYSCKSDVSNSVWKGRRWVRWLFAAITWWRSTSGRVFILKLKFKLLNSKYFVLKRTNDQSTFLSVSLLAVETAVEEEVEEEECSSTKLSSSVLIFEYKTV